MTVKSLCDIRAVLKGHRSPSVRFLPNGSGFLGHAAVICLISRR